MRDALGGTVNIVIIVAFIVIVLAYLAFNVNYTKAFRMKNKIVSTYEDFSGNCDDDCEEIIHQYAMDVGYNPGNMKCDSGWNKGFYRNNGLYCYKEVKVKAAGNSSIDENNNTHYYKIATEINIEIPIIQNVFSYQMFWVTGDTKSFPDPKK